MMQRLLMTLTAAACAFTMPVHGQATDPLEGRTRLYTDPDPAAPGGITGSIVRPAKPIEQILAVPPDEPRLVYRGEIEGTDGRSFSFRGLPIRKYDLVVIYADEFFEGLQLNRDGDTLTDADRDEIRKRIEKSEPYFPHKVIHRLEGQTGRGQYARAICTFYIDRPSQLMYNTHNGQYQRNDPRRAFKLVILKQVGPGWQIERTRDLYSKWATPQTLTPAHRHRPELSRIRVADAVKDLGPIDLNP